VSEITQHVLSLLFAKVTCKSRRFVLFLGLEICHDMSHHVCKLLVDCALKTAIHNRVHLSFKLKLFDEAVLEPELDPKMIVREYLVKLVS